MFLFKTLFQKELKLIFLSFRSWLIWSILLLFMGVFFFNYLDSFLLSQHQGSKIEISFEQMIYSYFNVVHFAFVLLIPSISMSAFSEEKQKGTFVLLQGLPISSFMIILAKYLSFIVLITVVLISSLIFPSFILAFGYFDPGVLIASYLGLFCACLMYLSIGVFFALFASHSFYGYIYSFTVCFVLTIIGSFLNYSDQASIFKKVIFYFSSSNHLNSFFKGYLNVADMVYFIVISLFFMLLSIVAFDHQRRNFS